VCVESVYSMDGTCVRRSVSRPIPESPLDHITHLVIDEVHTTGTIYWPGGHRIVSVLVLVLADSDSQ
jgi:7-keto-8-aminopelargonate synthetase-like enzyme